MNARAGNRGFTLISVLIAMVMLAVGLEALARSQTIMASVQGRMATAGTALGIARSYLEQVRGRDPWTLASESPVAVDELGVPSGTGKYTRALTVSLDADNLVRCTISVTYPRQSLPVQLVTLIYRGAL
jgi:type II secretory pathway pseudopilin PulG